MYTILTEYCSLSHLLNSYRKGKQYVNGDRYLIFNLLKLSRTASSVNFWLYSFLYGNSLYLLSVFLHSSILFIVFVDFLSILLRHSTFQPDFCGYHWSFLMLEAVFCISHWIVAASQQAPAVKYLSLCSFKIKRHSSNLLIRRWQWTRKYENEKRIPGFFGRVICL